MVSFPPSLAPVLQLITAITLGLVLLHVAAAPSSSSDNTLIKVGSSLSPVPRPSSFWPSPSGHFAFGFYKEGSGFAIGIWLAAGGSTAPTVVWTLMQPRGGKPCGPYGSTASLNLTKEGLLISAPGKRPELVLDLTPYFTRPISISIVTGTPRRPRQVHSFNKWSKMSPYGVVAASMLDSGNLVVYGGPNTTNPWTIWETFDRPTDTILGNQSLPLGSQLRSSVSTTNHTVGSFILKMQSDGDLVLSTGKHPTWSLGTYGDGYTSLKLDINGTLYLTSYYGPFVKSLSNQTSADTIFYARLEDPGVLQLYGLDLCNNQSGPVREVPVQSDKCLSENPCGQNSYCSPVNGQPQCKCLPGFNSTRADSGPVVRCQRNFSKPSCFEDKNDTTITLQAIENMVWIDEPYNILNASSQEECRDECLKDCDCQAVVFSKFSKQSCSKQKLPVKRARIDKNDQTVAYVKVVSPVPRSKKCPNSKAVVISAVVIVVVYAAYAAIGVPIYWHWFGRQHRRWREWQQLVEEEEIAPRCFSQAELIKATNGFHDDNELGSGGYGDVYRGTLPHNGRPVAVKKLRVKQKYMDQSFNDEMRIIGRIRHRNLVRLLGFSFDGSDRLLVYELMTKGSLAHYIEANPVPPEWKERMRIAVEVARGICYLHHSCVEPVMHCDIKPGNILLGENGTVKVSDFGEGKRLKPRKTNTFTNNMRGTEGYAAPEMAISPEVSTSSEGPESQGQKSEGLISVKADVYSFGVVLLELVYWYRNEQATGEHALLASVRKRYDESKEVPEPSGGDNVDPNELERVVKIGIWCTQRDPAPRPYMKDVLKMLEGNMPIPI